jgi:hypothetical protein
MGDFVMKALAALGCLALIILILILNLEGRKGKDWWKDAE